WARRAASCFATRCGGRRTRRRSRKAAVSSRTPSGPPATPPKTTRTTSPGAGAATSEGFLHAARRRRLDRRGGDLVRLAQRPGSGAGGECTPAPGRERWVQGLQAGRGRGADRGDRVLRLRVPVLRLVRDRADARDPRAAHRPREAWLALPRL